MASNLLELRRAAGYRSSMDFAEAQGIPASTYARYESNPDRIPLDRAWQLADALGATIDAVVGREAPDPVAVRGEVQAAYDGLLPEVRALVDEFLEFALAKDERLREERAREEERPYDALCWRYEREMADELRAEADFGDPFTPEGTGDREAFEAYLRARAEAARPEGAGEERIARDEETVGGIMAAYDRAHGGEPRIHVRAFGEMEIAGARVRWRQVEGAGARARGGGPRK